MKNIILQHWSGHMNELGERSSANISNYATSIEADYTLIRGDQFRPGLKTPWPPIQKLHMLSEAFDDYDYVVMVDIDMFVRKGMTENVFTDLNGVGMHQDIQKRLLKSAVHRLSPYANVNAPWWGGAIYKMDRFLRQQLRKHITPQKVNFFCSRKHNGDEGLLHHLAGAAKIKPQGTYFPDNRWCYCSFLPGIESSCMIHIRTKITPKGPKKLKIENYNTLVKKGLIE